MLNGLDLFSGIAGLSLALQPYIRTRAYCEIDRGAQRTLLSRMALGQIDTAPIWDDVRTLHGGMLKGIQFIAGGFPCQDLSIAGKRAGIDGERSGLFWHVLRLTDEIGPCGVFLENVPGIAPHRPLIKAAFRSIGYRLEDGFLSAYDVGANHIRKRWFALAYPDGSRELQQKGSLEPLRRWASDRRQAMAHAQSNTAGGLSIGTQPALSRSACGSENLAHASGSRLKEFNPADIAAGTGHGAGDAAAIWSSAWWATEPDVGRVAHGVPARVDRIRALGNAVVPLQARTAFEILLGIAKEPK